MAVVHIPAPMRNLTGGEAKVTAAADTLGELIERLEETYPGLKSRLMDGDRLRGGLAVFVDGETAAGGLRAKLSPDSEVYFAPAIAGGRDETRG